MREKAEEVIEKLVNLKRRVKSVKDAITLDEAIGLIQELAENAGSYDEYY